jgi:hypothetical protein
VEATALSAALDDDRLAAVVKLVSEGPAGPLSRSPFAVSRAVVAVERPPSAAPARWRRRSRTAWPAGGVRRRATRCHLTPLELPPAPVGTPPLRERLAPLVHLSPMGET